MSARLILVVDDEPDIRQIVSEILEDEGYRVETAENAERARDIQRQRRPDLILLDIWMPGLDGISLLKEWRETKVLAGPVIMMSGHGTIETAVEATKLGAYDFIEKPLSTAKMLLTIENALRASQLEQENQGLRRQVIQNHEIVGNSRGMQQLREQATRLAAHDATVLLYGEPGVGKETIARFLHAHSSRKSRPFIKVVLPVLEPSQLAEQLFGSEDAHGNVQYGLVDQANGGFLYLMEVSELDLESQRILVRALETRRFARVGVQTEIDFDCRVIASSSHDLQDDVEGGHFLEALFYQLSVIPLQIPPLRDHAEDIPELLNYYVNQLTSQEGLPYRHFTFPAQNFLRNQRWAGNMLELRNLVQRLLLLGTEVDISLEEAEEAVGASIPVFNHEVGFMPESLYDLPLRQAREQFEHDYLVYQLKHADGNVSKLADQVKMERTHLYRKMRSLGVDPKKYGR
ncbi:sigma-54-dependent transcriptional regulator [Thiolinea disciformis]|uniref:sigma-54-dependent transcriptional regulator n=1 Tax=Thiolinea disciformis TaxID=125614 RepID=UPI0003725883|nr:sigma-54 dependent transcriptional regulator [Thiolinea disciformis]